MIHPARAIIASPRLLSGSRVDLGKHRDRRELLRKVLINGSKKSSKQGMYVARKNLIVVVKLEA